MDVNTASRSRAIYASVGLGIGLSAAWGSVMATFINGDLALGLTLGAGAGLIIALLSGATVHRYVTA